MRTILICAALTMTIGAASAADQCKGLAELASEIADAKAAGIPQVSVASSLRAQYREDTEQARNQNALVERVIPAVYASNEAPQDLRNTIYLKCTRGELSPKRPIPGAPQR
jgi:hypothetical protein